MKGLATLLLSTFILSLSLPLAASAKTDTIVCNGCSLSDKLLTAKSTEYQSNTANKGAIIVVDFNNKLASKFKISITKDLNQNPIINTSEASLTSDELHDIGLLFDYRKELINVINDVENKAQISRTPKTESFSISMHSDNSVLIKHLSAIGSPYNFMQNSFMRNDLYDEYFHDQTNGLLQILFNTRNAISFPTMNQMGVYLKINFYSHISDEDPSSVISVDLNPVTQSFNVISARDKFNNSIPLTKNEINGGYVFTNDDERNKFEIYLSGLFSGSEEGNGCHIVRHEKIDDRNVYTYRCL